MTPVSVPSRIKQNKKYCRLHSNWASHYVSCVANVSLTAVDAEQRPMQVQSTIFSRFLTQYCAGD
jgi:hypothetical protein